MTRQGQAHAFAALIISYPGVVVISTKGDPVAGLFVGFCFSLPLIAATTALLSEIATPHWQSVAGNVGQQWPERRREALAAHE